MGRFKKCEYSEELLISRVQQFPELYNIQDKDFKNSTKKVRAWQEIAASFNGNVDIAAYTRRWRLLRDSYVRCKRESVNTQGKKRPRWRHFHAMKFIDGFDSLNSTVCVQELPQSGQDYPNSLMPELQSFSLSQSLSSALSMAENYKAEPRDEYFPAICTVGDHNYTTPRPADSSPVSGGASDADCSPESPKPSGATEQKIELSEMVQDALLRTLAERSDEDTLFVTSLVPYLKRLPMSKRLQVKIKFMQILDEVGITDDG